MKKEMYCFNCDKDVKVKTVKEEREYIIHNNKVKIMENVNYCPICHEELIDENLEEDLYNVYNEYLNMYNLSFNKFKEIRESLNLSQELFAKALGWSKKTIVRYENKQTLPQVEYLLVYKKIDNNKLEFLKILEDRRTILGDEEYYTILNRITLGLDIKTINVFLYVLKNNYLSITQIMKTFFAIDFLSFKDLNKTITSFKYAHATYGPIIDNKDFYLDMLVKSGYLEIFYDELEVVLFKPCMECDLSLFSDDEIKVLDMVKNKLKGKSAKELTEWSHRFKGWIDTKQGKIIDFKFSKYFDLEI